MPSDKKRVNLTIPDDVYERLQQYKEKNGLMNDATACFQLIIKQLKAEETNVLMLDLLRKTSVEQLVDLSKEGFEFVKQNLPSEDLT